MSNQTNQAMDAGEKWAIGISILALVVSLLSAGYTREQTSLTKEALARATGKIGADFSIVGFLPGKGIPGRSPHLTDGHDPENLPVGWNAYPSLAKFIDRLPPRLVVKNEGENPIDSVRIELTFAYGDFDPPNARQRGRIFLAPDLMVVSRTERDIVTLAKPLPPGQYVHIPLTKGLLNQVANTGQAPFEGGKVAVVKETIYSAIFEVRAYARLVGSPQYDGARNDDAHRFKFNWHPMGFPRADCLAYLKNYQDSAQVDSRPESRE